jgi:penicillin-binding protein 2
VRDNTLNRPVDGATLKLNIDIELQKIFYKHLKESVENQNFRGGAAVMMNANTGAVYAAVSYPDYDNNLFINATSSIDKEQKEKYLTDKNTPMLHRAIAGLYTPGSVVKPFMAYAALNENIIDQYKNIYSGGQLVIKNKYGGPDTIFRDWKAHGYVDARKAIAVSSDEYFYQIGGGFEDQDGLGIRRIDRYMSMFGFASSTDVDFPGEKTSIIPTPEWKKKNFADGDWLLGNTYHTSIGQYGFKTSPLQLAQSIAIIANGGKILEPSLATTTNIKYKQINLNLKFLNVIREGMHMTTSDIGTAHYLGTLPFSVAAKTGTAELGFKNERVNSWTSGYFPYEKPEYVFVLMIENGPRDNTLGASRIMKKVFDDMIEQDLEYTK